MNPVPQTVSYSLSEIEALAVKAARGAGYCWGLAEEAGMAARWLAQAGQPGPSLLMACLEAPRGAAPVIDGQTWSANGDNRLCPLITGATLSDRASLAGGPGGAGVTLCNLGFPALILPFAAAAARRLGLALRVDWDGVAVCLSPEAGLGAGLTDGLLASHAPLVKITSELGAVVPDLVGAQLLVPLADWKALERLALATTVPATSRSRAGAGSASSDND